MAEKHKMRRGKYMKKQIMSALLLLALLIGALPGAAAAGMERITVRFYDEK